MKKVSGFRFRVSGITYRTLLALMLLSFSTIAGQGFSYEMKYKFKKGQILKYQYDTDVYGRGLQRNDHFIYEFRVDSLSPTGAFMTIILKQHTFTTIENPDSDSPIYNQQSFIDTNNSEAAPIWYADIDKEISFHIAENGLLSQFQGVSELFNGIIAGIQKKESIGNKPYINYNWLKLRYSDDYYKMLIGYFLPPLPRSRHERSQESLLNYSKESIRVIHCWSGRYPDSATTKILFQKQIDLKLDEKTKWEDSIEFQNVKLVDKGPGESIWDPAKSIFTHMTFKGVNVPYLLNVWINRDLSIPNGFRKVNLELQQNKIELLSSSNDMDVMLNFTVFSVDSTQMDVLSPREMINPIMWTSQIPKAGRDTAIFGYRIVLDKPGLFYLKLHRMGDKFNYEFSSTDNILFYAQLGDTMDIRIDMEHPDSILFTGEHAKENQILQQFFHYEVPRQKLRQFMGQSWIPEGVKNDRKLLGNYREGLDPEFVIRLEFELDYTEREAELGSMAQFPIENSKGNLGAILEKYRSYLGQLKYHESVAYQKFIFAFVRASQRNAGILYRWNNLADYLSAEIFLQGWDRYWMLAKLAHNGLKSRVGLNYDRCYLSFMLDYAETPFGSELQAMYKSIRFTDDPTLATKLNLYEFSGHPVIVSFDYESTKSFYSMFCKQIKTNTISDFRILQFVNKNAHEWVQHELNLLKAGSEIRLRNNTDSIAKLSESLNSRLLLFDRDGKFVCSLISSHISELQLKTILSWPSLERPVVKKIDLTIFWYSLAGAFVLSFVIIVLIRLRSKRKLARLNLKRKIAQLEVDAVRSRMNPHFLFNALGSIQNLVNRGKNQEASLYLARFGSLVRTILTQSSKSVIGLDEEIEMIRNYLQLEQLGFSFVFDIQVDPMLDPATIEIPPLLIQPHVENAVIHGVSALGESGKIEVIFRLDSEHLICEVKDNGPGYQPDSKAEKEGLGQGWNLTRQRIQLLKEQYGEEVSADVKYRSEESAEPSGFSLTTVTFRLPMQRSSR